MKETIKFIRDAAPKIAKAYGRKIIGDVASSDIQEFRKSQCESCGLFNGTTCDKTILVNENNEAEYLKLNEVEQSSNYLIVKDKIGILRKAIDSDGNIYHRGCGCPQTGRAAKWKLSFDDNELALEDGTGPCPMGKWSKQKFNNWKNASTAK